MTGKVRDDVIGDVVDLEERLRGYPAAHEARLPQLTGDVAYVAHDTPVGRLLLAAR